MRAPRDVLREHSELPDTLNVTVGLPLQNGRSRADGWLGWLQQRVPVRWLVAGPGVAFVLIVWVLGGHLHAESLLECVAGGPPAGCYFRGVAERGFRSGDGGKLVGQRFGFGGGQGF
jgi:hypothetical protein